MHGPVLARLMSNPARRLRLAPGPLPADDERDFGEEALGTAKWFLQSKYRLMGRFLAELERPPGERDPELLRVRYDRALRHGERVHRARTFVTVFLAIGAITATGSAVANALGVGEILARAAAFSASATVLLLALRLSLDRYLERVDVAATFLAIQLTVSADAGSAPEGSPSA